VCLCHRPHQRWNLQARYLHPTSNSTHIFTSLPMRVLFCDRPAIVPTLRSLVVQLNVPPSSTSSQLSWKVHPRMMLPGNQQDCFGQHYHSRTVHCDLSNGPKRKRKSAGGRKTQGRDAVKALLNGLNSKWYVCLTVTVRSCSDRRFF
jgi:hypothetical protein